ncbi:hypothetical protein GCM10009132_20430 [Serratia ureilytica]
MRDVNRIRLAGFDDDGFARRRYHALAIGLLFDIMRRRRHDDALLRGVFQRALAGRPLTHHLNGVHHVGGIV